VPGAEATDIRAISKRPATLDGTQQLRRHFITFNMGFMPRSHVLTKEQRKDAAARYVAGESPKVIGDEYGVTHSAITLLGRRAGGLPHSKRRLPIDESAFSKPSPERNYWVGFLMADGCVDTRGYLSIMLGEVDRVHIEKLREFMKSGHKIMTVKPYGKNKKPLVQYNVYSRKIVSDLSVIGIIPNKTHVAKACDELCNDRDFWRGVVDGDGSLGIYTNAPRLQLKGAKPLLEQFSRFAAITTGRINGPLVKPDRNIWVVTVGSEYARNLIAVLYGNNPSTYLERKYQIALQALETVPRWPSMRHTIPSSY
jgi:hypothetical protein